MYKLDNNQQNNKYDIDRFMNPIENKKSIYFDIVDSEFLLQLKQLATFGTYRVLDEEGRPDLLTERIYGTGNIQYWWILMLLNELRLPKDLKRGMIIKFPTILDLEEIYVNLLPHIDKATVSRSSIFVKGKPLVRKESLD